MCDGLFERLVFECDARLDAVLGDGDSLAAELERCHVDVVYWVVRYCWTYDPREVNPVLPFVLFLRQEGFLCWLARRDALQENGWADRSRELGFTWLCAANALRCCLYWLADTTGFCRSV
jgi:phage terminase large subunit